MKKAKLIALAKTIISTSFPALRGLTLNLKIVETDDFVMAVSIEDREIHLEVSREDVARMGRGIVTGVLAHELCHAEQDCRHGPFLETVFSWLSTTIRKYDDVSGQDRSQMPRSRSLTECVTVIPNVRKTLGSLRRVR